MVLKSWNFLIFMIWSPMCLSFHITFTYFYFPIIWIYDFQKSSKKVKHPDLVGGIPTILPLWRKNMSSSVGMIIPNMWKNRKCSKPQIRFSRILNPDFKALNSSNGPVVTSQPSPHVWPPHRVDGGGHSAQLTADVGGDHQDSRPWSGMIWRICGLYMIYIYIWNGIYGFIEWIIL